MSRRRKHVLQALDEDVQPPGDGQSVVRALGSRGGNIVEVERADGRSTLVMLPAKFNKKLWVRRGGYLIVDESAEAQEDAGSRVTGTIVSVLYDDHVRQLKKVPGAWPPEFAADAGASTSGRPHAGEEPDGSGSQGSEAEGEEDEEEGSSESSAEPLYQNSNRKVIYYEVSESEEEEDEEEGEEEEEGGKASGGGGGGRADEGAGAAGDEQRQDSGGGEQQQQQQQQRRRQQQPGQQPGGLEVEEQLDALGRKLMACELGKPAAR